MEEVAINLMLLATSSMVSFPWSFRSWALTKTKGFAASTIETVSVPRVGNLISSLTFPVGNSFPVTEPPESMKSSRILDPVPGTPSILKSPSLRNSPLRTANSATITFLVLVL